MRTKLQNILTVLLLFFAGSVAFGQQTQTHKVYFSNIDGFSGYVDFTSSREGFATQLRGKNATLVLNDYRCTPDEKEALKKAGIDFWGYSGYSPKTFGVVVEGQAYIIEPHIKSNAIGKDKLHLNSNGIRGDFTTPEFAEHVKKRINELQRQTKTSQWEKYGGFSAEKVTELYLSELKNEIDLILYTAKKKKEKAEKEKQEAEEKEKQEKETKSSNAARKSEKKDDKKDKDNKNKEKQKERSKTIEDYAFEERVKGDQALQRGDYQTAEKHYKAAKDMGSRVDDKKYEKALAGSMAQSTAKLFSYIPSEDETVSSFTLSYYNHSDYWNNFSLSWTPQSYWGNFYIQWGFNFSYSKGGRWINQMAPKISYDKIYYETEQTHVFDKDIKNQLPSESILFSKKNDSYTDYAIYEYKEFESIGGGLDFGIGYRIPIASSGSVGLPIGITGFLNIANYSSNLGYRIYSGIELSRVFFRISFANISTSTYNFSYNELSHLKGTKSNTFEKLEDLGSEKKVFNSIQLSFGVFL